MKVKFNENNIAYVTFYKWDYGQELSFDSIPDNSEIHFPVRDSTDAVKVKVVNNKCSIPNSTLTLDLSTFDAWLYTDNGNQGETKKTIHFTLIQREHPEEHIYNFEEDKVLKLADKLDKFQGAENAGKTFVIDDAGNAILDNILPEIAVDCKLSEESNNPIANSAVAKVLSGGKLVGIETIFDYESLMDFNFKYFDFENEVPLIADNEFVMLLVLDDIYDESGEYGDTECLIRKGLYIWTSSDAVSLGGITEDDIAALRNAVGQHNAAIQSINKQIETFATKELFEQLSNVITLPDGHIRVDTYMLRGAGIYIIDCETTEIVIGSAKRHLLTMSKGEIFMVAESRNTGVYVRSVTAFTKQGIRHFPDVNADDLDTCRYLTNTETEKLVDEKLSALEIPVGSEGYRLIADVTTTEDKPYVLIDKDADDNAFDLKRVRVIIDGGIASENNGLIIKVSNVYNGVTAFALINLTTAFSTSKRYSVCDIEATEIGTFTRAGQSTSLIALSATEGYNPDVTSIDKLMIRGNTSTAIIPMGTKIQIWGY